MGMGMGIGMDSIPTIEVITAPQLIAPNANSIFPLPTLVSPHLPEEIPINPADAGVSLPSPIPSIQPITEQVIQQPTPSVSA
jgi:hypothetical protein